MDRVPVAVIGAGPYGLAVSAHLRDLGAAPTVFGQPMSFWTTHMPAGMLLRSGWDGSHISDPDGKLSLDEFELDSGRRLARPIPITDFVDYGRWFADRSSADLDPRTVSRLDAVTGGFRLTLSDGGTLAAQSVVVATGIGEYARVPSELARLAPAHVSHSSSHRTFAPFADKRVLIVGAGQSALESAALLHEAGADVGLVVRNDRVHWLTHGSGSRIHAVLQSRRNPLRPWLFPPSEIGPIGVSLLVDRPSLFTHLPTRRLRARVWARALRPAGAQWLRPRLQNVPVHTSTSIADCRSDTDGVTVHLTNGNTTVVDHILLATGYSVDVARCAFLSPTVLDSLRRDSGYPVLSKSLESSVRGLYFVGAAAAGAMGPLARFVAGTGHAARAVASGVAGAK